MPEQSFIQGAFILIIANSINRILGFILRVTIVRFVGDEVLGLFQMVFPIFTTLLIFSSAGFPVAIAKLIPEEMARDGEEADPFKFIKVSILVVGFLSAAIMFIYLASAKFIATDIITDQRTYLTMVILAPALFFCPLASILRGYFQGLHDMTPTALSQIAEQICRFISTVIILSMVGFIEFKYQAAGLACGIVAGELCGFLLLIFFFTRNLHASGLSLTKLLLKKTRFFSTLKGIITMAVPVTTGRFVNSLMWSAEAILIPRQLNLIGLNNSQAASLFGQLTGMAEPIIFLPTIITLALHKSLLPAVSAAKAVGNLTRIKQIHNDILRMSIFMGLPVATICLLSGRDICNLLYNSPSTGSILAVLGLSAPFVYYHHVSAGMLHGLGHPTLALVNLSLGSIAKIIGIIFLTRIPNLGIYGSAISITLNYAIACLLNFIVIRFLIRDKFNVVQLLLKPVLGCGILYAANPYLKSIISTAIPSKNLAVLVTFFLLSAVYLTFMLLTGAITPKDLKLFKRQR